MTRTKQITEATKLLSNRRNYDKFSLHYIIKMVNHGKYFYSYLENKSRDQWLECLLAEINTDAGLNNLLKLNTFKHLQ